MNISVIIIGRNSNKTLSKCINSLKKSLNNTEIIEEYEIIYVDSNSIDNSIELAKEAQIQIIEIIGGYTSASLGRYLGKQYSKYENLLFLDSDMDIDESWFIQSFDYYIRYKAIIGERYEKLYKNNSVLKEIPNFYGITKLEEASHIGGFLMIKKELIEKINYSPLLKDEEEKDFYAKFYDKTKIFRIPINAYIHNNYNLTASRIRGYFSIHSKNGYILSMIKSFKDGYFKNYLKIQKKYLLCISISVLFYISLVNGYWWSFFILIFLVFNGLKNIKGSLMTTLFFPYKFLTSIVVLLKNKTTIYRYKNEEYELEIKL